MRRHIAQFAATLTAAIAVGGLTASAALADGSTTTTTPTPAVKASISLTLPDVFTVHGAAVTVPRRELHAAGVVKPYVPGQSVVVRSYLGHKLLKTDTLRIKPSANQSVGLFTQQLRSPRAGILRIQVSHARTPQMLGFYAQRAVAALTPQAGPGARGRFVALIQQRLTALHVYVPQTGVFDLQTGLALDAYHRLLGWGVSQRLDGRTVSALLNGEGSFHVRFPHDGTHVEGNLHKQLLALIYGDSVYRIYPISSGKPSTPTILGHFRVYLRTPGYLPDGMYYSDFFHGGYAIHGYDPAPDYPASHGCMRLPIVDAISVFDWLNYGDVVDVYS